MAKTENERITEYLLIMRGVTPGSECKDCLGLGTKSYGSTALWRKDAIGGQAFTTGPCDQCWGSGDKDRPWPSHREFYDMKKQLEK